MRFVFDRKLGRMAPERKLRYNDALKRDLLDKVMRYYSGKAAGLTDAEVLGLMDRIHAGTRNSLYLLKDRPRDGVYAQIVYFLLREVPV